MHCLINNAEVNAIAWCQTIDCMFVKDKRTLLDVQTYQVPQLGTYSGGSRHCVAVVLINEIFLAAEAEWVSFKGSMILVIMPAQSQNYVYRQQSEKGVIDVCLKMPE